MDEAPEVYVACEVCGGEGHTLDSRYGGNDPDVWATPCRACNGAGGMICEASGDLQSGQTETVKETEDATRPI